MIASIKSAMQRDGFRRYLGNTSWLLGEKILRLTLGLFVGIWLARYLGPGQFGILSYAESFVAIFAAFMTLGLNSIVVRELVRGETGQDILLGTSLFLRVAGSLVMLALVSAAVYILDIEQPANTIILIIAVAAAFRVFEVIDFFFQARVISRYSALSNGCVVIASSLLKIYLILNGAPLVAFAWVFLFDVLLLTALYLYFYRHQGCSVLSFRFRAKTAGKLLADSWPLVFSGLLISIYMKIDQIMLQEYLGSWHVGQYAAAVRLSDAWLFITVVITNSLFPAIINAREKSSELFRERMTRLYKLLVFIALVISCSIFIFSEQLVLITFGDDYSSAIQVLRLYIWSIVFVFLNNASWKWYIAENLQRIAMLRLCLGAIVNIGLNMLFIPEFGLQGAAYATLISYILATYLGNALHPRTMENFRMQTRALLTFYSFNR
jgi:O-antigen/teichoic acid export membrane protein